MEVKPTVYPKQPDPDNVFRCAVQQQSPRSDHLDLVFEVNRAVIEDLKAILDVEYHLYSKYEMKEILENWWSARKYLFSKDFEEDCESMSCDYGHTWNPEVIRKHLRDDLVKGREIYGRVVRTLKSIDL